MENVTDFLDSFFNSITSDQSEELAKYLDAEAAITLPQSAYRFDTLKSFANSNIGFNQMGGRVVNADVRQVRVEKHGDCTLVSCYFAQRIEIGDRSVGNQGKATVVLNGDSKIVSLHLSEVASQSGFARDGRGAIGQADDARGLLAGMLWGCE